MERYILKILNSNLNIQNEIYLKAIFDQTISYNQTVAPNTVCISQPGTTADQCVDLNKVNDQEINLSED
jgi:hypothetical protein